MTRVVVGHIHACRRSSRRRRLLARVSGIVRGRTCHQHTTRVLYFTPLEIKITLRFFTDEITSTHPAHHQQSCRSTRGRNGCSETCSTTAVVCRSSPEAPSAKPLAPPFPRPQPQQQPAVDSSNSILFKTVPRPRACHSNALALAEAIPGPCRAPALGPARRQTSIHSSALVILLSWQIPQSAAPCAPQDVTFVLSSFVYIIDELSLPRSARLSLFALVCGRRRHVNAGQSAAPSESAPNNAGRVQPTISISLVFAPALTRPERPRFDRSFVSPSVRCRFPACCETPM